MTWRPKCPSCDSRDVKPCDALLESSAHLEDVRATHECNRCGRRFRDDPPKIPGFTGTEVIV